MSPGHNNDSGDLADARFASVAGERLRVAAGRLDPTVVASLDRARRAAVLAASKPATSSGWRVRADWVPVAVAAGVAGLVLTFLTSDPPGDFPGIAKESSVGDMEIVLAGDNLEMLEELEFYAWMADQQDAG